MTLWVWVWVGTYVSTRVIVHYYVATLDVLEVEDKYEKYATAKKFVRIRAVVFSSSFPKRVTKYLRSFNF